MNVSCSGGNATYPLSCPAVPETADRRSIHPTIFRSCLRKGRQRTKEAPTPELGESPSTTLHHLTSHRSTTTYPLCPSNSRMITGWTFLPRTETMRFRDAMRCDAMGWDDAKDRSLRLRLRPLPARLKVLERRKKETRKRRREREIQRSGNPVRHRVGTESPLSPADGRALGGCYHQDLPTECTYGVIVLSLTMSLAHETPMFQTLSGA
jgi:hypothetical protein